MHLWFGVRFVMGCVFLVGCLLFLMDMIRLTWGTVPVRAPAVQPQAV